MENTIWLAHGWHEIVIPLEFVPSMVQMKINRFYTDGCGRTVHPDKIELFLDHNRVKVRADVFNEKISIELDIQP
jgi:hypothetical protein